MQLKQEMIEDGYEILDSGHVFELIAEQIELGLYGHDPEYESICFAPSINVLADATGAPPGVWFGKKYQR